MLTVFIQPAAAYEDDEVVGTISSLIRGNAGLGSEISETALGDVAADALRSVSQCDIAIVNGGELLSNLQVGDRTWLEILAIFEENKTVGIAQITAAQLWEILEYGVSFASLGENQKIDAESSAFKGFPQVSGVEFKYDLSAPAGERIQYILVHDTPVDREDGETRFSLCATVFMLKGGYGYPVIDCESMEIGLADALAAYMSVDAVGPPSKVPQRIYTIGNRDDPLVSRPMAFVIGLLGCIIGSWFYKLRTQTKTKEEKEEKKQINTMHTETEQ